MTIQWGHESLTIKAQPAQTLLELPLLGSKWRPVDFAEALAHPTEFPELEKCATPEDRVVVALDPTTIAKGFSLPSLLGRLAITGISESQVTIVLPANVSLASFESLRETAGGCQIERHDPKDPNSKVILGGTRAGDQIYLNRRVVEADLLVIVSGTRFTPSEHSPASLVFPGMACDPVLKTSGGEVLHLLGSPYLLTVVDGPRGFSPMWTAGTLKAFRQAKNRRKQHWHAELQEPVKMVILNFSCHKGNERFCSWARSISRVLPLLENGGRILIVGSDSDDENSWQDFANQIRHFQLSENNEQVAFDITFRALKRWSKALEKCSIFILDSMPAEICEDLQANKISGLSNIQKLASASGSILLMNDPDKCSVKPLWMN